MIAERRLQGYWWDVRNPATRVSGELTVTKRGVVTLSLNGSFDHLPLFGMPPQLPVIVGFTNAIPVTLCDCIPTHRSGTIYHSIDYHVGLAFLGDHLPEGRNATFRELELRLDHMFEWAGTDDLRFAGSPLPRDPGMVGAAAWFEWGGEQEAVQDQIGSYRLAREYELNRDKNSISVTQTPYFKFVGDTRKSLSDLTSQVISPLRDLVSFASDTAVAPTSVLVRRDATSDRVLGPIRAASPEIVREFIAPISYTNEQLNPADMLFMLTDYSGDLQVLLDRWYQLTAAASSAMNVLVGDLYSPPAFVDNRLLLFLLAAEAYHRRMLPELQLDEENSRHAANVLNSCPQDSLDWLTRRLSHAGEPGYRKRLKDLIRRGSPPIDPLVPRPSRLADQLYEIRNAFAHSAAMPDSVDGVGASELATKLLWVLKVNILLDLGFSVDGVTAILARNRVFRGAATRFAR